MFKFIAADHKSYSGNDFFDNIRFTDEGMSATATNAIEMITGIKGQYDNISHRYLPPNNKTWQQVAKEYKVSLQVKGNIKIISIDGNSYNLAEFEKNIILSYL